MLGAQRPHELESLLADVDADDAVAERVRDLHRVVPEATGRADDRDGPSRRDAVGDELPHRAERGEATARERGFFVAELVRDAHERGRPHAHLLGEGAHERPRLGAEAWPAAEAVVARAAPVAAAHAAEAEDHAIADVDEPLGARAERVDDTDRLVAEGAHRRHAHPVTACEVEVGVAYARRADAHACLVGCGVRYRGRHRRGVRRPRVASPSFGASVALRSWFRKDQSARRYAGPLSEMCSIVTTGSGTCVEPN